MCTFVKTELRNFSQVIAVVCLWKGLQGDGACDIDIGPPSMN
ncbi:hypothetical protein SAMN04488040_1596 [Sulfitobacter marinus]|uniref:Uncharacterized protein n=1 Tax=Sulfitobacter marinus TaxID=394264 RepID=A0A1I6RWH7_9RHOB|nr:hypothetical protein SAMN04488040_1596 [Sulfitobacter marinus]